MSTAIIPLSPVVSGDQVQTRLVTVTVNTIPQPAITLPPTALTATYPCSPGDVVTAEDNDTNVVGTSADSNISTATDPFPVPTAVPTTPTVGTISFTDP